ncbi:hypothetical protein [Nocardioides sp.]|uniref:hypothetical protein n=1 Tax=Nocardioides sp. TaxID=35761 RepID=UPI003D12B021
MRVARSVAVTAAVLAFVATGCSGDPDPAPSPSPSPSATSSSPSSTTDDPSPDPDPDPGDPVTNLLDWTALDASRTDVVTKGKDFTIVVDQAQRVVTLDNAGRTSSFRAPARFQFNDVLTDGTWLVMVAQDKQEVQPSRATVVELATGDESTLDGDSDLPTVNGGSWAVGGGTVLHPTLGPGRRYCLASVELPAMKSTLGYCAPRRAGFSHVLISPTATSLLTFSGQPQCRTVARLDGATITPFPDVTDCKGWDGAVTATGAVWSVVTNENRVEQSEFFASAGEGEVDLGPGTTGSLTWCGDSAYFVRDSQKDVDKARLLRWTPQGRLEVVYESPGSGEAFLTTPRCAGDVLTINAFGEGGDEQVWAPAPS